MLMVCDACSLFVGRRGGYVGGVSGKEGLLS